MNLEGVEERGDEYDQIYEILKNIFKNRKDF